MAHPWTKPLNRNEQGNHVLKHLHPKAWSPTATTLTGILAVHSTLGVWAQTFARCRLSPWPVVRVVSQVGTVRVEAVGVGVAPSSTPNTSSGVKWGEMAIQGLQ